MVSFIESTAPKKLQEKSPASLSPQKKKRSTEELERELQVAKEILQTTIEELETTCEELRSSNEELQSTNEELQSTNEELETSKEELQSLNEESVTINAELQSRVDELSETNDDMKNLLDSTQIATLFLDTENRIRRFTPKTKEFIPLTASDIERPIGNFSTTLHGLDLSADADAVLTDLVPIEREVVNATGETFKVRVSPYRTLKSVIDGIVFTFIDISQLKQTELALRKAEERMRLILQLSGDGAYEIDKEGKVAFANDAYASMLGYSLDEFIGMEWSRVFDSETTWDVNSFNEILLSGEVVEGENSSFRKDGTSISTEFRAGPIFRDGIMAGFIGTIRKMSPSADNGSST